MAPTAPPSRSARCLLIVFLSDIRGLRDPSFLKPAVTQAAAATEEHLRIVIVSHLFGDDTKFPPTRHWGDTQKLLTVLYAEATRVAQEADNVLMNVEVVLQSPSDALRRQHDEAWEQLFFTEPASEEQAALVRDFNIPSTQITVTLSVLSTDTGEEVYESTSRQPPTYPVVALGGTFDHLHAGHKILLSMSASIASTKVIVGMTDDTLLTKKTNREVLETLSTRTERVRGFLNLFKPGLEYDVVPIQDVYGPTAWDPNIQALVVSKETLSGAASIAKLRSEKGFPPLESFVIDVISPSGSTLGDDDTTNFREAKMSSTFIRQWIVNKRKASQVLQRKPTLSSEEIRQMPGGWVGDERTAR